MSREAPPVTSRAEARRQLGVGAVLTEAEAVGLLPCRDTDVRAWLRQEHLVHDHPILGRIVIWREVLDHLQFDGPAPAPVAATLPRAGKQPRAR